LAVFLVLAAIIGVSAGYFFSAQKGFSYESALDEYASGNYDQSLLKSEKILEKNPTSKEAMKLAANSAYSLHNYGQAVRLYRQIIASDEADFQDHLYLGSSLLNIYIESKISKTAIDNQLLKESEEALEMALQLSSDSNNVLLTSELARVKYRLGKYQESIRFWNTSFLNTGNPQYLNNIGWAYLVLRDLKAADSYFERATGGEVNQGQRYLGMGWSAIHKNQSDNALMHFQQVQRLHPNELSSLEGMGVGLMMQSRCEEAIPYFKKVVGSVSAPLALHEFATERLGRCYFELDNFEEAEKYLEN